MAPLHKDHRIRIFFSSPGDVQEERPIARDLIDELQRLHGEQLGVNLIYKGWETDTYPEIGRPQGVINQQIGEYEIFVGVFWNRYGTPTGEADSGTVEEFERALKNHDENGIPAVLFYFRQSPGSMETVDELEQKRKIIEFREQYGDRAGLYDTYTDLDNFKKKLRGGLLHSVKDLLSKKTSSESNEENTAVEEPLGEFSNSDGAMQPKEFVYEALKIIAEDLSSFSDIDLDDTVRMEIEWEDPKTAFKATIYSRDQPVNRCRVSENRHRSQYLLVCMLANGPSSQPEMVRAHVTKRCIFRSPVKTLTLQRKTLTGINWPISFGIS